MREQQNHPKNLKSKTKIQVETALDLGNKNRGKMKKTSTFDLSYFIGKRYFNNN